MDQKIRGYKIHEEDNTSSCSSLLHYEAPVQRYVILMVQAPDVPKMNYIRSGWNVKSGYVP